MERLTIHNNGIAFWADSRCAGGGYRAVEDVKDLQRLERLAAYEDAMPLERAQELAQAEKDGRLVVLPSRQDLLEFCPMRVCKNGNCSPMGGFCQPGTEICKAMQAAYERGIFNAHKEAEAALKKGEAENEAD